MKGSNFKTDILPQRTLFKYLVFAAVLWPERILDIFLSIYVIIYDTCCTITVHAIMYVIQCEIAIYKYIYYLPIPILQIKNYCLHIWRTLSTSIYIKGVYTKSILWVKIKMVMQNVNLKKLKLFEFAMNACIQKLFNIFNSKTLVTWHQN